MAFRSDRQRKAVMSKLRAGSALGTALRGGPGGVKSKAGRELQAADYKIIKEVRLTGQDRPKWFEVIDPTGEPALILQQSPNKWHWFSKKHGATASGSSPEQAHRGGLGDAIDTDSALNVYKRLIRSAPHRLTMEYEGLSAARQQVE